MQFPTIPYPFSLNSEPFLNTDTMPSNFIPANNGKPRYFK